MPKYQTGGKLNLLNTRFAKPSHCLLCHLTWIAWKQLLKWAEHLTDHWKPKYQRVHWGEIYLAIHCAHACIHHFCLLLYQRLWMQHFKKFSFAGKKPTKTPPQKTTNLDANLHWRMQTFFLKMCIMPGG